MSAEHVTDILKHCLNVIQARQGEEEASGTDGSKAALQLELGQSNSAVFSIITIMNRYEDNDAAQEPCCAIIRELCHVHDSNRSRVTAEGGLKAVLVALLKHEHAMAVQVNGLGALANLAMNASNQNLIPEMRGLEVVKTCMEAYPNDGAVQTEVCRIITALASDHPRNSKALAALGLGKAVVRLMWDHESNQFLQRHACEAVRVLTCNNEINRVSLTSAGAFDTILLAMKTFESNDLLQAAACRALWNLTDDLSHDTVGAIRAYNTKNNTSESSTRILLMALRVHARNPFVQEAGCGVLKHLTAKYEADLLSGHVGTIVPTVLNAMRQHQIARGVQTQGCGVLCNLAMLDEHKGTILNEGGIGVIIGAMKELQDSVEVQKQAFRALRSLSIGEDGDQNKISIAASGGLVALFAAMERYQANVGVQLLALGVLQQLVAIPRNRNAIVSNDGVRILELARTNHCPREKSLDKMTMEILHELGTEPSMPITASSSSS